MSGENENAFRLKKIRYGKCALWKLKKAQKPTAKN